MNMARADDEALVTKGFLKTTLDTFEARLRADLASKKDLQKVEARLGNVETSLSNMATRLLNMEARMDRIHNELLAMRADINGRFDAFIDRIEAYARETVVFPQTLDLHGQVLRNHEKRISALES